MPEPCSFCLPLSSAEWDLWLDQEVKTSAYGSTRISVESLSPATEGLGSPKDSDVPIRSDSHESSGHSNIAVSSGEDIHLASHSGLNTTPQVFIGVTTLVVTYALFIGISRLV